MSRFFTGIDIPWWSEVSVLVFFLFFVGIVLFAYSPKRKQTYEKFGEIPMHDDK